jgi:hypothetical protein
MRTNGAATEEGAISPQPGRMGATNGPPTVGEVEAAIARDAAVEARPAPAEPHAIPPNHRELGRAIFAKADPVKAGCEILEPGEQRADPTRLNALKTFANWTYGMPDAQGRYTPPRIIWDLPCPPYEPADPEEQNSERGEA